MFGMPTPTVSPLGIAMLRQAPAWDPAGDAPPFFGLFRVLGTLLQRSASRERGEKGVFKDAQDCTYNLC